MEIRDVVATANALSHDGGIDKSIACDTTPIPIHTPNAMRIRDTASIVRSTESHLGMRFDS